MPRPPPRPRARIAPICRNCGYDVSGIGAAASDPSGAGPLTAVCPECGTTFDPRRPWLWPAWPTRGRIALRMIAPLLIAAPVALLAGRSASSMLGRAAPPTGFGTALSLIAFLIVITGAIVVVTSMTDRHLPMPQGRWIKGGLLLLSLAVNLGGLLLLLAVR